MIQLRKIDDNTVEGSCLSYDAAFMPMRRELSYPLRQGASSPLAMDRRNPNAIPPAQTPAWCGLGVRSLPIHGHFPSRATHCAATKFARAAAGRGIGPPGQGPSGVTEPTARRSQSVRRPR
jgi:hypothetical protein